MLHTRFFNDLLPCRVRRHRGHGQDAVADHHHDLGSACDPLDHTATGKIPGGLSPSGDADKVRVMTAIYDDNDRLATQTSDRLRQAGVLSLNIMGAPGVGKTSSIIALIRNLPDFHHYVVEGDIESDIDTQTMRKLGVETLQINTHGACHLDAHQIAHAVDDFRFDTPGLLLIENIGNLVCPAEMVIGEQYKILIVTATDGSDKPYKYPLAFEKADLILLNKADLLPYVDFDQAYFMAGVRALNPLVEVLPVNARLGDGFAAVADWIRQRAISLQHQA